MCLSTNPHGKGDTCGRTVQMYREEGESSKAMRAWVEELRSSVSGPDPLPLAYTVRCIVRTVSTPTGQVPLRRA